MKPVLHALAFVGILLGVSFFLCAGTGFLCGDPRSVSLSFLALGGACMAGSLAAWFLSRNNRELQRRDAVVLVLASWLLCGILGSIPYFFNGICRDPASALFESFSGLTTTGASVLSGLETLPRSILFWRSLTHFLGGMGILIVFIAILPFVGAGGVQLHRAEAMGLFPDRLTARIADTARIILGIYVGLNGLCAVLLRAGGLSWFDALCHAFGTIATGGFSTRSGSIAAFQNPAVEWILLVFMFLSGVSFVAHYRALKGNLRSYYGNSEFRLYAALCLGATAFAAAMLFLQGADNGPAGILRSAAFQTVSLFTTTGYSTANYDAWPGAVRLLLLLLMTIGACAGSTTGAIKGVRLVAAWKLAARHVRGLLNPLRVETIRLDGEPLPPDRANQALIYIVTYATVLGLAAFLLSLYTPDTMTAASAAIACLGNTGPGMAGAGPTETYAQFPAPAKLLLTLCMILGRLEIHLCLAALTPGFWKR